MTERRKDPRSSTINYQERRRNAALEQQASARARALESRRRITETLIHSHEPAETYENGDHRSHIPGEEAQPSGEDGRSAGGSSHSTRSHWASQLMTPEWLVESPQNLANDWFVLPRPEGQRCLVVSSKGQTVARARNGAVIEVFTSGLPAGGVGMRGADHCILDCIYHPPNQTYYVTDIMCWRGHDLYDCTTEFRFFWMHSKLSEDITPTTSTHISTTDDTILRHFAALPAYPATSGGLHAAYSDPVPFVRDGLYFVHRRTHYTLGQTPLALTWKDPTSSRYFIDTDAKGVVLPEQHVVLRYQSDRGVCTADEPPVTLATMPQAFVEKVGAKLRPGRLLRFAVGSGGVTFVDGAPMGADLRYVGVANQRRGRADALSKILFQMLARTKPITIEALMAAAGDEEVIGGGGGGEGLGDDGVLDGGAASIGAFKGSDGNEMED